MTNLKDAIDAKEKELVEGLQRSIDDDLKGLQRGPSRVEVAVAVFGILYILWVVSL